MPYRGTAAASRIAALILISIAGLIAPAHAKKQTFGPGQWEVDSGIPSQQICIVGDGTWYGTTFNWNGHWSYNSEKAIAVMFGNYGVDNQPFGYGNDTLTIFRFHASMVVAWEDWYDDETYAYFDGGAELFKIKAKCDKPYTGTNTQAASQ